MENDIKETVNEFESDRKNLISDPNTKINISKHKLTIPFKRKLSRVEEENESFKRNIINSIPNSYESNADKSISIEKNENSILSDQITNNKDIVIETSIIKKSKSEISQKSIKNSLKNEKILNNNPSAEKESLSAFQQYLLDKSSTLKRRNTIIKKNQSIYSWLSQNFKKVHSSSTFVIITTIIIFIDLFIEDLRKIFAPHEYDYPIEFVAGCIHYFFFLEMILNFIFVKNYRFSAFFFLDLLASSALTPTFDVFYSEHEEYTYSEDSSEILNGFFSNSHVSKTSKASITGTRLSRIFGFMKILRVFSFGRIYKHNLEKIVASNEKIVSNNRQKELVKLLRRKNLVIEDFKDKKNFFKQIHDVLNSQYDLDNNDNIVNPVIVKNYYNYALRNEKKNSIKIKTSDIDVLSSLKNNNTYEINENLETNYNEVNLDQDINDKVNDILILKENINEKPTDPIFNNKSIINLSKRKSFLLKEFINPIKEEKSSSGSDSCINISNASSIKSNESKIEKPKTICYCDLIASYKAPRRCSLISHSILTKINNTVDGTLNLRRMSTNPINDNQLNNFKNRELIYINNKQDELSSINNDNDINKNNIFIKDSIAINRITNYIKKDEVSFINCDKCGGFIVNSSELNESINTFIDKNEFSRRTSMDSDVGVLNENKRVSIFNSNIYRNSGILVNNIFDLQIKNEENPIDEIVIESDENSNDEKELSSSISIKSSLKKENSHNEQSGQVQSKNAFDFLKLVNKNVNNEVSVVERKKKLIKKNTKSNDKRNSLVKDFDLRFFQDKEDQSEISNPKLSLILSKAITIKVVILVLFLLFSMPFLDPEQYFNDKLSYDYEINRLASILAVGNKQYFLNQINKTILNETYRNISNFNVIKFGFISNSTIQQYDLSDVFNNSIIFKDYVNFHYLRADDRIYLDNEIFFMVYNLRDLNLIVAILSLTKIIFIAVILAASTFFITSDVNILVVMPLENTFSMLRRRQILSEHLYYNLYNITDDEYKDLIQSYEEIYTIERFFSHSANNLIKTLGIRMYNYFKQRIFAENKIKSNIFYKLKGIIMVIKLSNFDKLCNKYNERICSIYSKIINIIDLTSFEHFGEILKIYEDKIIIFWDENMFNETHEEVNEAESNYSSDISSNINSVHSSDKYDSYEVNEPKKDKSNSLIAITNITNINNTIKNISNFSLITAIKILARINKEFSNECEVKLNFSITKGKLHYFILNSTERIEISMSSHDLSRTIKNMKIGIKFDIPIIFTEKLYYSINYNLRNNIRDFDFKKAKIYIYDVYYTKSVNEIVFNKDQSLMNRRKYADMLNDIGIDIYHFFRNDFELFSLKSNDIITFINYFRQARFNMKMNNREKALSFLKHARLFKPDDKLTEYFIQKIEQAPDF